MKHSFSKTNSAVAHNKGRVGEIRYYTKEGYTYSRTAYADVPNPRTDGQMKARVGGLKDALGAWSGLLQDCHIPYKHNYCTGTVFMTTSQQETANVSLKSSGICISSSKFPSL